jgi:transcriptional regulator
VSTDLDLLQGTLDVLILKALTRGAAHGYGIARWIKERSEGAILVEDKALYVALHRMEDRGWVESEWGLSEHNRRAKYYDLTGAGRRALAARTAAWTSYSAAMTRVLS